MTRWPFRRRRVEAPTAGPEPVVETTDPTEDECRALAKQSGRLISAAVEAEQQRRRDEEEAREEAAREAGRAAVRRLAEGRHP